MSEESTGDYESSEKNGQGFVEIIEVIADKIDPLVKLLTVWTERALSAEEFRAKYRHRMAWVAVVVVSFVIAVAGTLTGLEKIDGSTFAFLLGLVVGYVLTFVKESIGAGTRRGD